MLSGYYTTVVPSVRANEPETPLDRAMRAKKVKLVSLAMGGWGAEAQWIKIFVPKGFSGTLAVELELWARWQPAEMGALPPADLKKGEPPVVVRAYDSVRESLPDFGAGMGTVALIALLYLLARR